VAVGAFDDRAGAENVGSELGIEVRRGIPSWATDGVEGAVGGLKLGTFVAWGRAAWERAWVARADHRVK